MVSTEGVENQRMCPHMSNKAGKASTLTLLKPDRAFRADVSIK